mmetsp:Transcript_39030/g.83295  ORF Transcript_39030/g.83295 Transcript_39030/m.83295 type:complete len:94 (+) Transcript_39030:1038-1319(+)
MTNSTSNAIHARIARSRNSPVMGGNDFIRGIRLSAHAASVPGFQHLRNVRDAIPRWTYATLPRFVAVCDRNGVSNATPQKRESREYNKTDGLR